MRIKQNDVQNCSQRESMYIHTTCELLIKTQLCTHKSQQLLVVGELSAQNISLSYVYTKIYKLLIKMELCTNNIHTNFS